MPTPLLLNQHLLAALLSEAARFNSDAEGDQAFASARSWAGVANFRATASIRGLSYLQWWSRRSTTSVAYSSGMAVSDRTLTHEGSTFSQSTPTCPAPASSAKKMILSRHASISSSRPKMISKDRRNSEAPPLRGCATQRSRSRLHSANKAIVPLDFFVQFLEFTSKG